MKKIFLMFIFTSTMLFCNWNQGVFTDSFGDPTGNKYIISNTIDSTFSNSATKNSKLFVELLISSEPSVGIFMSEYSGNRPAQKFEGYIQAKNENGKTYSSTVFEWNRSGGISIYDKKDLIKFLRNSKNVKFVVSDKYSSTYHFSLDTQKLEAALDLMNKKTE